MWVPGFIHDVHDLSTPRDIYTFVGNIFIIIVVVHGVQIFPIILWVVARTAFNRQRHNFVRELLETKAASRSNLVLDFSCQHIGNPSFQTEEVIEHAYRRLVEVESGVERSMIVEALAIRQQSVCKSLDGIFMGAPWYQIALGLFPWRLVYSSSDKDFCLEKLRPMVCDVRDGRIKLEKRDLES
ncbi:hypothetical protein WAI453_002454 [Rhynchosporium graminicola]